MPPSKPVARTRPLRHLGLAVLTLGTTTFTFQVLFGARGGDLLPALSFGASLLAILGSHEMGHWLLARHHRVDASLPYFIPTPLLGFGTLGAVIRIRGPIPHRTALVDIGAAGPLLGLVVALPLLAYGLAHSPLVPAAAPLPFEPGGPGTLWWMARQVPAAWSGGDPSLLFASHAGDQVRLVFGDNLLMWTMKRWVLGPLPPGLEVAPHPVVLAAWLGMLVTMLNLLPIGQLDGGHLAHALLGDSARHVGRVSALGLAALALFASAGWVVWLAITAGLIGFGHPAVSAPSLPLGRGRAWICAACGLALLLCLIPVPLRAVAP